MIIKSLKFNYKLLNGTLVIAIIVLVFFSLSRYTAMQEEQVFLNKELKLVQSELSNMIEIYQNSRTDRRNKTQEVNNLELKEIVALDNSSVVETDTIVTSVYLKEFSALIEERRILDAKILKLLSINENLKEEFNNKNQFVESQKVTFQKLAQDNIELLTIIESITAISSKRTKAELTKQKEYDNISNTLELKAKGV